MTRRRSIPPPLPPAQTYILTDAGTDGTDTTLRFTRDPGPKPPRPRTLSTRQVAIYWLIVRNPGLNTHRLAVLRADGQTYESVLRDRLRVLERRGLVRSEERVVNGRVMERVWWPVEGVFGPGSQVQP